MKTCLNLGCGHDYRKSTEKEIWINLDQKENKTADINYNINNLRFPFCKNSFDYILFSHVIEHLNADLNITDLFNEISRILKEDGILELRCPHFSSWTAYQTCHHRYFDFQSLNNAPQFKVIKSGFSPYAHKNCKKNISFISKTLNNFICFLANLNPHLCERLWCYWVGGMQEMFFIYKNKKQKIKELDLYLK